MDCDSQKESEPKISLRRAKACDPLTSAKEGSKRVQASIGIITQARMASQRLPGKVLKKILDQSLLQYHLERLEQTGLPVIVATTTQPQDDRIVEEAQRLGFSVFRSSEDDVLRRYYEAAKAYHLDVIIRVTSDCPLIDARVIDEGLESYLKEKNYKQIYLSNCLERRFPRGFDFEIFSKELLEEAYLKASQPFEREHVTPYFYKEPKAHIHIRHFLYREDKSRYRVTVDTAQDFELIEKLMEAGAMKMSAGQIIHLLDTQPSWVAINAHVEQKSL